MSTQVQGSSLATGVSEASPASPVVSADAAPTKSILQRVRERLAGPHSHEILPAAKESPTARPQPTVEEAPKGQAVVPDGEAPDVDPALAKDEAAKADKDTEKSVPLAVLQERVAREVGKTKKLQSTLREREVQVAKANEALTLLSAELQRVRDAWSAGHAYDERDDAIAHMTLKEQAQARAKHVEDETSKRFTADDEAEVHAAKAEAYTETFQTQIAKATESFPLAEQDEIVAGLKRELQRATSEQNYRPLSANMVAKRIHEKRLAFLNQHAPKAPATPQREAPASPKAPAGGSRTRPASIREGIREALEARRIAGDL